MTAKRGGRGEPLPLLDLDPDPASFLDDVVAGLRKSPRELPSIYFYDAEGSRLFERITKLDAYYLTRVEAELLTRKAEEMAADLGPRLRLIELGCGSGEKTKLLLAHLVEPVIYLPVDISREALMGAATDLARTFPQLEIQPVCADYGRRLCLPDEPRAHRTVAFFPGSTIGNLHPGAATDLLARLRSLTGSNGGVLLGVDRKKAIELLVAAYADPEGITAEFNFNLLRRINRELGGDFEVGRFDHLAKWNAEPGRMESYLVSRVDQIVRVGGIPFGFVAGDRIWTESSYKYDLEDVERIARPAGLRIRRTWSDPMDWFSLVLLDAVD